MRIRLITTVILCVLTGSAAIHAQAGGGFQGGFPGGDRPQAGNQESGNRAAGNGQQNGTAAPGTGQPGPGRQRPAGQDAGRTPQQGGRGQGSGTLPAVEQPKDPRLAIAFLSERAVTTTVAGRIRPSGAVTHPAGTTGVITSVAVEVGQSVRAGSELYTVEREDAVGRYVPFVVRSRIGGVVAEVPARVNNEIRSGENGVTVIDTKEYILTAQISDKDAFSLTVGIPVNGKIVGGSDVQGTLVSRSPEPDYKTGLFTITVRLSASVPLYAGQFVTMQLPVESERGIFVKQNVLVRRYGRYYIWIVKPEGTLTAQEVTTGTAYGDMILIRRGLNQGDTYLQKLSGKEREGMTPDEAGS